jgi:uncharacterized membrane protein YraQ (UPF0718 family)
MNFIAQLTLTSLTQTWQTFTTNWPFLLFSLVLAVLLKNYLKPERVTAFLQRHQNAGVVGATALAVTTPFCSCGTTAVILGMMANSLPWAPIVAFMVASPLTSPEEMVYSAGLFGWRFAWAFFASSILLGLAGGVLASLLDQRGWLKGQARMQPAIKNSGVAAPEFNFPVAQQLVLLPQPAGVTSAGSFSSVRVPENRATQIPCTCGGSKPEKKNREELAGNLLADAFQTGRQLLLLFFAFSLIGHFLNGLIPASWMAAVFGSGRVYGVPLAATLGLPLYVNSEASLPLVRTMLDAGMSQGAALAFLITGAGTSIGAFAGALAIARWRVIALVVGTLWAGAILIGFIYNLVI